MKYNIITTSKVYRKPYITPGIIGDLVNDDLLLFITKHDLEHVHRNIEPYFTRITEGINQWRVTDFYFEETAPKYLHVIVQEMPKLSCPDFIAKEVLS